MTFLFAVLTSSESRVWCCSSAGRADPSVAPQNGPLLEILFDTSFLLFLPPPPHTHKKSCHSERHRTTVRSLISRHINPIRSSDHFLCVLVLQDNFGEFYRLSYVLGFWERQTFSFSSRSYRLGSQPPPKKSLVSICVLWLGASSPQSLAFSISIPSDRAYACNSLISFSAPPPQDHRQKCSQLQGTESMSLSKQSGHLLAVDPPSALSLWSIIATDTPIFDGNGMTSGVVSVDDHFTACARSNILRDRNECGRRPADPVHEL